MPLFLLPQLYMQIVLASMAAFCDAELEPVVDAAE
jgi:hypothetical protein